jgi:hypothetical protein
MSSVLNAQSTCQAINGRIQEAAEKKSSDSKWATFTDPASMWRNKTENNINNTNVNYLDLSTKDILNISNSCSNIATGSQTNVINQDPACLAAAFDVCKRKDDTIDYKCIEMQKSAVELKKISQSNMADVKVSCQMNNLIKTISSKASTLENATAVVAAQKASGIGSQASATTSNCNEVRTDMSSQAYTNLIMNCANQIANKQSNAFNACNGNGIDQSNNANLMNSCLASNNVFSENIMSSKVKAEFTATIDQKSDMLGLGDLFSSPTKMIISAIIIIVLFCASYFAYSKIQDSNG